MTTTLPLEVLKLVGKEFFLQGGCSEEFPVIEAVEQEISELKGCFGISDRNVVQLFTWLRDNNKDYAYLQYHAAGVIDKMLAWKNTPKEVRSPGGYFLSAVMEGWQHLKELPKAKPTVYEVICPTCGHRVYRGDTHCLYCNAAVSKEIWHDSEDSAETR